MAGARAVRSADAAASCTTIGTESAYGNGDLGNQGIHQMDLCRWGLGVDKLSNSVFSYGGRLGYEDAGDTANTQMIIHDYGDQALVFEVRGLTTETVSRTPTSA